MAPGRDSGGLRGGIVASRRDLGGLGGVGGGIEGFRRDSGGLGGGIVAARRDSIGLRGRIKGFGRVGAFIGRGTRLLTCILGSNGCKAFLF